MSELAHIYIQTHALTHIKIMFCVDVLHEHDDFLIPHITYSPSRSLHLYKRSWSYKIQEFIICSFSPQIERERWPLMPSASCVFGECFLFVK